MHNFYSVDSLKVKPAFWIHKSLGWFRLWQVTIIVGFNLKWFQYIYGWSWPWWTLREIQHIAVHCNQNSTMCLLDISQSYDIQLGISFVCYSLQFVTIALGHCSIIVYYSKYSNWSYQEHMLVCNSFDQMT